jgi:hypothetical protein
MNRKRLTRRRIEPALRFTIAGIRERAVRLGGCGSTWIR